MYRHVLLSLFISLAQYFAEKEFLFEYKHVNKIILRNVLPVYVQFNSVHEMKG